MWHGSRPYHWGDEQLLDFVLRGKDGKEIFRIFKRFRNLSWMLGRPPPPPLPHHHLSFYQIVIKKKVSPILEEKSSHQGLNRDNVSVLRFELITFWLSYRLMILSVKAVNSDVKKRAKWGGGGGGRSKRVLFIPTLIQYCGVSKDRKAQMVLWPPQMSSQANMKEHKLTTLSLSHDISSRPRSMPFLLYSTVDKDLLSFSFCSNQFFFLKRRSWGRDTTATRAKVFRNPNLWKWPALQGTGT